MRGAEGGKFNRWIAVRGFRFQPVEFAKIALIIHTAHFLARYPDRIKSLLNGVIPNVLIIGLMFGLVVMQPDFGSAVLLAATAGSLLFIGGIRITHTLMLIGTGAAMLAGFIISNSYRLKRLTDFWASMQSPEAGRSSVGAFIRCSQMGWLIRSWY